MMIQGQHRQAGRDGTAEAQMAAALRRHGAHEGPLDAEYVVHRLEHAGRTLLALPDTGPRLGYRLRAFEIIRPMVEAWGADRRMRPPLPHPHDVTLMDEAFCWLACIPQDRYVLRRIVGARALVSPLTDRHLYSWSRLGTVLGADSRAIRRWHATGVDMIVGGLALAQRLAG
ncbi:conserved protein of unknown function [Rhodovastum atsumiense]|uniref:Uncharacterized protein n=1 Tax=Rhodovastum atsumiense TaxID=504468 RepID=A0A5M6II97_9PROT|nr:hypothetical protein [Rhodovastum atsumiense]KAA5607991.1 hypothetical protein F1189_31185 [Rhodovastum atsumiense]CAH2602602.1 conserved protein of unknown function [Rhodovastum atsumiense]